MCIEALGKNGGYICGGDHHTQPDVPPANAVALYDTARAFRGRGYTNAPHGCCAESPSPTVGHSPRSVG